MIIRLIDALLFALVGCIAIVVCIAHMLHMHRLWCIATACYCPAAWLSLSHHRWMESAR